MTPEGESGNNSGWEKAKVIILIVSILCNGVLGYLLYDLNKKLYEIQNPKPDIAIININPIEIGPSFPFRNIHDDRVTFDYNGSMNLEIEVSVFTKHYGKIVIPKRSDLLYLEYSNWTQIGLGFTGDVQRDRDFTYPIQPETATLISMNFSFVIGYRFLDSPILQYSNIDIGTLWFRLEFYDLQTSSREYTKDHSAKVVWNNQTSLA